MGNINQNLTAIIEELANLNPPKTEFNNKLILKGLEILGNPQHSYQVIHIAGTNGKGSTAAFIEEGLWQAKYTVGKFTSPYIHRINECISLNKAPIKDDDLARIYQNTKKVLELNGIFLSSFEMLTCVMFLYFKEKEIDYLVLETGMGGRDDSTNVVKSSVAVITNIGLEHTQWLGNSLTSIAEHKTGIIKPGTLTILGDNCQELVDAAKRRTNKLISIRDKYLINSSLNNQNFTTELEFCEQYSNITKKCSLNLYGHFQAYNFLCAYEVLRHLGIAEPLIWKTAAATVWPGRLQVLNYNPLIIADASHNTDGVATLYNSVKGIASSKASIIICSILKDKNINEMLDWYCKISDNIIFCSIADQPRASCPIKLARLAKGKFKNVYLIQSPLIALRTAKLLRKDLIIISGSTYLLKYFLSE